MSIISICYSGKTLLQAFSFLFANNESALNPTWYLSFHKEVLIDILGDFFIMVVNNIIFLFTFIRETRFFGIIVIEFTFSDGLYFSGTTVEIYVRVAARLVFKISILEEEC